MAKLSQITTPSLTYDEGSAPSTPASGKVIVYAKTDGLIYSKDDAGVETLMSGGAGGGGTPTFVGARVYHNATQSIGDSTDVKLNFNQERFDTSTFHDTSSNNTRITVGTTGYYNIGAHVGFAANNNGYRQVYLLVNNTTAIAITKVQAATGTQATRLSLSTVYALTATDYVEVVVAQTSGGSLNTEQSGSWTPEFWIQFLGS